MVDPYVSFDIGIIGVPFDTAVSYRPGLCPRVIVIWDFLTDSGARFGPRAIRAASNRHLPSRGFSAYSGINPYTSWARIIDCGDIPVNPFDNSLALRQMTEALEELSLRSTTAPKSHKVNAPKLLILGGDHSIALPALRAMKSIYGEPMAAF